MYRNEEYDEKVDVFSFAICMYEVIVSFDELLSLLPP